MIAFSSTSLSIVTIIFSIFVAAFSIVSSSASDDFVLFIEKRGSVFSIMMADFKYNAGVLMSVILVNVIVQIIPHTYHFYVLIIYKELFFTVIAMILVYALLSSIMLAYQVVHFSDRRVKFLKKRAKAACTSEQESTSGSGVKAKD